jgi:hypothetical protein
LWKPPRLPRVCVRCRQQYQPRSNSQRVCGSCVQPAKEEWRRAYNKRYYARRREDIKTRARARRWEQALLAGPSQGHKPRECNRCHQQYKPASSNQKYCPSCRMVVQRDWRRTLGAKYRRLHPDKVKESKRRTIEKYRERYRTAAHESWVRHTTEARRTVFGHYSDGTFRCACCGESEYDFLTIDHVNNDGAKHRMELFGRRDAGGVNLYRWLIKKEFPPGFAVLCMNCNFSKGKHRICIHQATVSRGTACDKKSEAALTMMSSPNRLAPKGSNLGRPDDQDGHL